MGKSKKDVATLEDALSKVWCYYCEKICDDDFQLMDHQKKKHYTCLSDRCGRRLNTAGGLRVHMEQVHKEQLTAVPNAKEGRQDPTIEIFGMVGVPQHMVDATRQGIMDHFNKLAHDHFVRTGNQLPSAQLSNGPQIGQKRKVEQTEEEKKAESEKRKAEARARVAALKAKKEAKAAAEAAGIPYQETPTPPSTLPTPPPPVSQLPLPQAPMHHASQQAPGYPPPVKSAEWAFTGSVDELITLGRDMARARPAESMPGLPAPMPAAETKPAPVLPLAVRPAPAPSSKKKESKAGEKMVLTVDFEECKANSIRYYCRRRTPNNILGFTSDAVTGTVDDQTS